MLDLELLRKNPEFVKERLRLRREDYPRLVDKALRLDEERRSILKDLEALRAERNALSKEIGKRKSKGEQTAELEGKVKEIKEKIEGLEGQLSKVEEQLKGVMLLFPTSPIIACRWERTKRKTWRSEVGACRGILTLNQKPTTR